MDYFLSHLPAILIAGCVIAAVAVLWTILLDRQAKAKRQRVQAKQQAAKQNKDK